MRLLSVWLLMSGLAACSDDGVPAASTGTDGEATGVSSTGTATTAPTTAPTSTTADPATSGATDEVTTADTTGFGSESTFGPSDSSEGSGSGSGSGTTEPTGSTTDGTGTDSSGGSGSTTDDPDPGNVGDECMDDMDCDSGICWSWNDYDPFCHLMLCSVSCMGDDECVGAFEAVGAPYPENVFCSDGVCWPVESGLGSPICE